MSVFVIAATSCEKFSGDQEIPAYLAIDSIYITTDYYLQGSASQRITDAWIYIDDDFLGAFELPAKLPVLKTGAHHLKVWPGIKKNGIASTRINYEFYKPVEKDIVLAQDSTLQLGDLKTGYQTTADFIWKEDFEEVGITLDTTSRSTAFIQRTPDGSLLTFEGIHSGMVELDSLHDYFECQTHTEYTIPAAPVFLEMNFNANNAFTVGVFTYGTSILYQSPIISLNPTNGQWKKIYIDLTTTLNAYTGMKSYRVYLSTFKDASLDRTTILLDNFKIVTRKSS